ncbi:branched-chain amino acid ABC transporter ATP-binding protein/permease [Bradyrhizobium sp.]|uniref:branched-chain amino acid ABC transporter ATP-binding protein/permease n=1 Tax=Bradyrhizobium sp. TaxID=376 RepID=UPI00261A9EED|nr:branched-chain amino acid ABC transporter ATP-binding protein/permease [Bradyrhizobium sp.]
MIAIAAIAAAPLLLSDYYIILMNYIGLASLVALGLVLLTGVAGLTSFGQAAFVGLGAYATAVVTTRYGWSPWLGLAVGMTLTATAALFLGFITLRLSDQYLPLGTIAWGISIYFAFGNLVFLGEHSGIPGIPPLSLFGWTIDTGWRLYLVIWLVVLLALLAARNLLDSRIGRAIRTLNGHARMAESFGVDTGRLKIIVFVYSALLASLAGWLYAHFLRYVSPSPFGINAGIDYLFMAVIGGSGHIWGAVAGASILTLMREWLKDILPHLLGRNGNYEIIVFGLLVVLLLHRTSSGLMPFLVRMLPGGRLLRPVAAAPLPQRPRLARGETLLAIDRVSKSFGAIGAVRELSFELKAGGIVGLIGPNGAGKSTVFNLATGLLPVTAGSIMFRGQRIERLGSREIAELGIARTFQHPNLLADRSALENAAIGAHLRGEAGLIAASLRLERAEEARLRDEAARQLERVGLGANLHDAAGSLPLGSQRILEIARALCADPLLLLLDEPAAGLRHLEKQALAALLRDLRDDGVSILLVEHDMNFLMGLADRVLVMEFGRLIADGPPHAVQSDPAVLEAYLGVAA